MLPEMRRYLLSALEIAILSGGSVDAWTQAKRDKPSPNQEGTNRLETSEDWFKWGADIRLRNDSMENPYLTDADPPGHSYSFERLRLREWNTFSPNKALEFNLRFTWEGRHYWAPASKGKWDESDVVLDSFNGKFKFQDIPMTLIVGRQDIAFGDGWLVSDGTPLDGPRTNYFDAIRTTLALKGGRLDLVFIDQTSSPDRRLRPLLSKGKPLMEQDERGAIAYLSNATIKHTQVDIYFIYKHDEAVLPNGDNGDIYTLGNCLTHGYNNHVSGRVESAYQFGHRSNTVMFPHQNSSLSAWGLNCRLTCSFLDPRNSQAWIGYEVLSGNDARDARNHQFDPLWGRWGKYSELFPNDLDRPGDRSNLHRINIGYLVKPTKGTLIQSNYQALFAYANRYSNSPGFSVNGNFKGHLFTTMLRYQLGRFWNGYLLGEYFIPGNYYDATGGGGLLRTRNDPATFLRAEIVFTF